MRNSIQRSIYSHILGNIKSLVLKKGYSNMNPFKDGPSRVSARMDGQMSKVAPPKEKSSWWSGLAAKIEKKDSSKKESEKETDLASPFFQNFVHIVSMCEEFFIQDMRKEIEEEQEEETLMADLEEEPYEEARKKKRKRKKNQLLADFGLMEQILYIFDCTFWEQPLLSQVWHGPEFLHSHR